MGSSNLESSETTNTVILLAAGKSSRAGMPKGLIEVQGRPWIECQIEALKRAGMSNVIVVLGHQKEAYERVLRAQGVMTTVNPDPDRGPFSSLQSGLGSLPGGVQAAWVLPVDVPCPSRAVWEKLEQEASLRGSDVALPVHQGKGGHPVRLSRQFARQLMEISPLEPEARLDHQIHRLPTSRISRVEVEDPRILANLNTPDDFARHVG